MAMSMQKKQNTDQWESRQLGASAKHAIASPPGENEAVDQALGLQAISIRLQSTLIDDLKEIAKETGLAYQPLIRMVLTTYVKENEHKLKRSKK